MNGPNDLPDSDALETLVFQTLERMEEEGPNALDQVVSDHPELETELRSRLDSLRAMGLVQPSGESPRDELPHQLGPYELGDRLGEGGMGLVFKGHDTTLDRVVALKLIRPELLSSKSLRQRFQREATAVGRLQHPGIARVYGSGEEAGFPYMALEYVPGCTLAHVLDTFAGQSPISLTGRDMQRSICELSSEEMSEHRDVDLFDGTWGEACVRIVCAVAEALAHAHAAGILHRDIKASNVMVTPHGRIVLIDFGLAQLGESHALTATGGRVGSLPYTAPERIRGASDPSASGDVYGLGVLLYELLALRLPFQASTESALVSRIALGHRADLLSIAKDLPPAFADACERAMRMDPLRRPPGASAFAMDLARALAGRAPLPHGDGVLARVVSRWRSHPVTWSAVIACGLLLLALPTAVLAVQASAAERTSASDARSLARLELAVDAAHELQAALPITDAIAGTKLAAMRTEILSELVRIRSYILADGRLSGSSEKLRSIATWDQQDALARLGRPDPDSPLARALPNKGIQSVDVPLNAHASTPRDRTVLRAAHLALARLDETPGSTPTLQAHIIALRALRATTSDSLDTTITLVDLLHRSGADAHASGSTEDAVRWIQEAHYLVVPLTISLPQAAALVARRVELEALLTTFDAEAESQ